MGARGQPHMWNRLVGQEPVVRALRDAIERDAVGHAYLFGGPEGVGRTLAALALAASLNCPDRGCGSCAVCQKVLRRSHPDVHLIAPEGAQILVSQVRALREDAHRSPHEGRVKVFVVEDAERLNAAAANALLKTLEEPPGDVVFVLVTTSPDDLPPTILSRCRRLDFAHLPPRAVRDVLVEHHGVGAEKAEWAARVSGNLARALRVSFSDDARDRRDGHVALPARLARGGPAEAIRAAEEVKQEAEAVVARLRERHKREIEEHAEAFGEGRGTAAARKRLEDRHKRETKRLELDVFDEVLEDLASFYRDILLAGAGAPTETLVNTEIAPRLVAAGAKMDPRWLVAALDRIEGTRHALRRNAMPGLAMEAVFMDLGEPRIASREPR